MKLLPFIAAISLVVTTISIIKGLRKKRCPRCSLGRLEWVNFAKAQCVDDRGRRYPDCWTYYECDRCKAKFKISRNGKVEDCGIEEWSGIQPDSPNLSE